MSEKRSKQELIQLVQDLAKEYGRRPTYIEFENIGRTKYSMQRYFGSFDKLLIAAGIKELPKDSNEKIVTQEDLLKDQAKQKLVHQYKKLCSKKEQLQGHFRHVLDLEEMFSRAGNPKSLKLVAQPDTHTKFRDVAAVNCFIKFMEHFKPDVHLIMGDFVDCEGVSHWPSDDMDPRRLIPEIQEAYALLKEMVDKTPQTTTRIFLEGNHENWISKAMAEMPGLLDGMMEWLGFEPNVSSFLKLKELGYDFFQVNHIIQIGKAHFTHGLYSGSAHAKSHLDKLKASIYYGHLHDLQEHNQTSIDGHMEAASLGCLCRLDAKFLKGKPNNWVHAFGVFEFFPDGSYNFYKPRIFNGRMSFNGVVFDGN